jgi:hypothetical protein
MEQRMVPNQQNAENGGKWTLVIFEVQLGVPISEDEMEYLPEAQYVDGRPCYPEHDANREKRLRCVTMSYPPHKAEVLDLKDERTLNAAFLRAVAQAKEIDEITGVRFVNLGVRPLRRRLIENTLYSKNEAAAS